MTIFTAITTAPDKAAADAASALLEALEPAPMGVGVFAVEDGSGLWEVAGYFRARPDPAPLAIVEALLGLAPFAVSRVDDRDWVAQVRRELRPVRAGRFVVHGGHDAGRVAPADIGLRIEAAMAFGTGHHATTRGCLLLIHGLGRRGLRPRRVADVGCGTGVLAMAAARLWRAPGVAGDIEALAVATARANLAANRAAGLVPVVRAAGLAHPLFRARAPYGLLCANILAGPLKRLAPEIARHLAPGGAAILSGILSRQAPGVEAVCRGHGLVAETRIVEDGWTSLLLRRRRPLPRRR